jgi:ABC-type multidrug transport system ATPase subunit
MNVLAGRRGGGTVDGSILFNGTPLDDIPKSWKKYQAYVLQDDVFLRTQTVREAIEFSAKLRLYGRLPKKEIDDRVNAVLEELNLMGVQNSRIGAPGLKRGISGGERKRVAVGLELVQNPSLLYLDEVRWDET